MIKMLIIADDFTGALDTGVKFSAAGAKTKVSTDTEMDFTADISEEVLVLCVPTPPSSGPGGVRHDSPHYNACRSRVYRLYL